MSSMLYHKFKDFSSEALNKTLEYACSDGDLETVKYLLTSPELKEHAYVSCNEDSPLYEACRQNRLDVVKYLLTSSELKEHANIHAGNEAAFRTACYNGHLEIVRYLSTSLELKEHADLHVDQDEPFIISCSKNHMNIVEYFIFELNIQKSTNIEDFLSGSNEYKKIENMFNLRNLNKKLNQDLSIKQEITRKPKV